MDNVLLLNLEDEPIKHFYQWDSEQHIVFVGIDIDAVTDVHFCNIDSEKALVVKPTIDGNKIIAKVPNKLLQLPKPIIVYLYDADEEDGCQTIYSSRIVVVPRPMPEDYVYTEDETMQYIKLDARIKALEDNAGLMTGTYINVASLPTSDIDDKIAYRVLEGIFVGQKRFRYDAKCHTVDWESLPTEPGESALTYDGEQGEFSYGGYYNIADNEVYAYINSTTRAALVEAAKKSGVSNTVMSLFNGYLESRLKDGWKTFGAFIADIEGIYETASIIPGVNLECPIAWGGVVFDVASITEDKKIYIFVGAKTYYRNNGAWTSGDFTIGRRGTDSDAEIFNDINNIASAPYAHAEGSLVTSSGAYSHAEGYQTEAGGLGAHAEGQDSHATGNNAHAEGSGTTSSGTASHTEGVNTQATTWGAHAEGGGTEATKEYAHAEGYITHAIGQYAHSEGNSTTASGIASHSEGAKTQAIADYSHAEGHNTKAAYYYAHAEGVNSTAVGEASHAEGLGTEASGAYSHAEGQGAKATAIRSHAEGHNTVAKADASHAGGKGTIAAGIAQTAIGRYNAEDSSALFIVGNGDENTRSNAFIVNNDGSATLAKVGENDNNVATVGYVKANAGSNGVGEKYINEGGEVKGEIFNDYANNIASGGFTHAEGYDTEAVKWGAHAEGGDTHAMHNYAHAEGLSTYATGESSHAEGQGSRAGGIRSHAEGFDTCATGEASHAEGYKTSTGFKGYSKLYTVAIETDTNWLVIESTEPAKYYSVGDNLQIGLVDGSILKDKFKISSISETNIASSDVPDGTYIALSKLTDENITITTDDIRYIGVYNKPYGDIIIAEGAHAHSEGYNTLAIGENAHAEGYGTQATKQHTHAEGYNTTATAWGAHAEGGASHASGQYTHAEGLMTKAEGTAAHSEGQETKALGDHSHAEGVKTEATGNRSHAEGNLSKAKKANAHAEGYNSVADGYAAHSEGGNTLASGDYSHAGGLGTIASKQAQTAIGQYNAEDSNAIFIVGNGNGPDADQRKNAFTVNDDGSATASGSYGTSGADYAEYFEWADGNENNEDRVGYLVAIDGERIRKAISGDSVFGITSATPAVLGDTYDWYWHKKYVTDEFGRIQYKEVELFDENGNSVGFEMRPVINPEFDCTQSYVPRSKRREWSAVGFIGKLYVRDDGSCVAGGYVKAGENGIAARSDDVTNIRVLKRTSENIVYVFVK